MQISRRGLITGLGSILAAPAIVRVASIMPVKAWPQLIPMEVGTWEGVRFIDELQSDYPGAITATEIRARQAAWDAQAGKALQAWDRARVEPYLDHIERIIRERGFIPDEQVTRPAST